MNENHDIVKVSVRSLVEFIFREGDITSGGMGARSTDLMQMGSRIHRKIQKSMGPGYESEVPLSVSIDITSPDSGDTFTLIIEGRADGIFYSDLTTASSSKTIGQGTVPAEKNIEQGIVPTKKSTDSQQNSPVIDEIKGVMRNIKKIKTPEKVHLAQAMCYAYMVLEDSPAEKIGVQITYANLETENIKRFLEIKHRSEVTEWFEDLITAYKSWAVYMYDWQKKRNASIFKLNFPYEFRPGQKELVAYTYKKIQASEKFFIQAPTGVGKTISTVFPSVKAMGEHIADRIFYLTAKTITRTVAEQCFSLLSENDLIFKPITLTAKEKLCILDKPACNPGECERAWGHFDRVNDAIYDMLTSEDRIDRETIIQYSEKHRVCPFEMSLDAALFADAVICDYNYVFDPNVHLKRFFDTGRQGQMILLIDEAHNLIDRAREMFSATLVKEDFLYVIRVLKKLEKEESKDKIKRHLKKYISTLEGINRAMLALKRECEKFEVIESIGTIGFKLLHAISEYDEIAKDYADRADIPEKDKILELFFDIRNFSYIYEELDDNYKIYTDYDEDGNFRLTLSCIEPGERIANVCENTQASVFFSATLLPIRYYKEQLGGKPEDAAIYAKSIFEPEKRKILIATDVTSTYKQRGPQMYSRIAMYIEKMVTAKRGNYIIFFPSYVFMDEVVDRVSLPDDITTLVQDRRMNETGREEFLSAFEGEAVVGFCVMGGVFSEGIDLPGDRLIGTAIVGTGLPMVCDINELYKDYFEEKYSDGFDYAYRYPGFSKVLQAGGRVIRTEEDRGIILLLDNRFLRSEYLRDFPKEWQNYERVSEDTISDKIVEFWSNSV